MTVNGIAAAVSGTDFTAVDVPLIEGGNTITATATDANGHVATATVHIVRDRTAPRLAVYYPADGSTVYDAAVDVTGLVNDIVPGTVNEAQVDVTVNGVRAGVANRSFVAAGVRLEPGPNTLAVVAVDASGNRSEIDVHVQLGTPKTAHLVVISGARQTGIVGNALPQPLVVEVEDGSGNSIPGQEVVFKVTTGDGVFQNGKRLIAIASDEVGRARTVLTLGKHSGMGAHIVQAYRVGLAGPAVFIESATAGPPTLIVVDSGSLQIGVTGHQLPRPIVAAVVDDDHFIRR